MMVAPSVKAMAILRKLSSWCIIRAMLALVTVFGMNVSGMCENSPLPNLYEMVFFLMYSGNLLAAESSSGSSNSDMILSRK
jgi:Mg2+ and Co2+ transporter CorA